MKKCLGFVAGCIVLLATVSASQKLSEVDIARHDNLKTVVAEVAPPSPRVSVVAEVAPPSPRVSLMAENVAPGTPYFIGQNSLV